MRISKKVLDGLYQAIHTELVDVRIRLKLPPKDDVILAQVEHAIWMKQKRALGLPDCFKLAP